MNLSKEYKSDIRGDAEIRLVVDAFYTKIRADENLAPIFADRVKDWSTQMPQMYAFWGTMLFGKKEYQGNPLAKHMTLPVDSEHFQRWVALFVETVDQLFAGPKAEQAKAVAKSIAHIFQIRMGIDPFGRSGNLL